MLTNITIRKRIVLGYVTILGVAVVGITLGFSIGSYYQAHALELRRAATAERKLIGYLQTQILYNHPLNQLGSAVDNPARFQADSQALLDRITRIQSELEQHHTIHGIMADHTEAGEHQTHSVQVVHTLLGLIGLDYTSHHAAIVDHQTLHHYLMGYEQTIAQVLDRTQTLVATIHRIHDQPDSRTRAQQALLDFVQGPEFTAFLEVAEQLEPFIAEVDARENAAELALREAEAIRTAIILGSLLASTAIAGIIALYNSRAIAYPIHTITDVAYRVTQSQNFDLSVPITSDNEVGLLADSLNQLIQRVNQLVQQLHQKNRDLQAAYQQLQQQQVQLVQSEKMSSLGQLVAGIAHEINNPINFIHGNLAHTKAYIDEVMAIVQALQQEHPEMMTAIQADPEELAFIQADLRKILGSMQIGSERIRQIVLSLRNFSRLDEATCKAVDLHEGLESSLLILQHRLKPRAHRPGITVSRDYGELPLVECYPGQLNQVIMNILANAIDAIEERSAQSLEPPGQPPPRDITIRTSPQGSDWVEIAITDTGIGMSAMVRDQIFQPFFTTKPKGIGTGIGLSISHQIVTETHQGKLDCISTPGVGTEFVIGIPVHQSALVTTMEPRLPAQSEAVQSGSI